ncbi:MAG: hypothetical protein JXP36_16920 [Bacteroidales bacterium]|nr:hypothetical protein [Bacteroidales bacterium]
MKKQVIFSLAFLGILFVTSCNSGAKNDASGESKDTVQIEDVMNKPDSLTTDSLKTNAAQTDTLNAVADSVKAE